MLKTEEYKSYLPKELFTQIEEVCGIIKEIQQETAGLMHPNNVSDASNQLHDVLQATEDATNRILDAATAIQGASQDPQITDLVTQIYEACNFQDITGQRIKKVLQNLSVLDEKLLKLASTAKAQIVAEEEIARHSSDRLAQGPQLTQEAPSQEDIDNLFKSL